MKFSHAIIGKIGVTLIVGISALCASGCGGEDTIGETSVPSPDGRWVASAETLETSGFGTGAINTDAYLKWAKGSDSPEHILGFVHGPNSTSKTINLSMKWVSRTHLDVTYDGSATIDFQVVKYGDVDISLEVLSKVPNGPLRHLPDSGIRIVPNPSSSPAHR